MGGRRLGSPRLQRPRRRQLRSASRMPAIFMRWRCSPSFRALAPCIGIERRAASPGLPKYDGCRSPEAVTSHAPQPPGRAAGPKPVSQGEVEDPLPPVADGGRHVGREPAGDRLPDIADQFVRGLALRRAAGKRRDLRPEATLFGLVHDDLDVHGSNHRRAGPAGPRRTTPCRRRRRRTVPVKPGRDSLPGPRPDDEDGREVGALGHGNRRVGARPRPPRRGARVPQGLG